MDKLKQDKIAIILKSICGVVLVIGLLVAFVLTNKQEDPIEEEEALKNPNKTDIISDFVDIRYERSTEADTEFIRFVKDGSFSYYCACGNPVDNSDLCEYYTYDKENNKIELVCYDGVPEKEKNIKILTATKDKLKIEINGEIREFTRTKEIEE